MNPKRQLNRERYLQVLRQMTPEQRLRQAMDLSEMTQKLFRIGLRRRFPDVDEQQLQAIYLQRLARCHNRNY